MKKLLLILIVGLAPLLASLPVCAAAQALAQAALSGQDQKDLSRIENYLNELKNVSANFLQIDEAGGIMRGEILISRPGKMRVTYDPPSKDFIIADGSFVHIWNEDLKSQTNIEQGSSLAEFILRDPIKLGGEVTVTKFKRFPSKIEITLVQKDDQSAGSLTLVFEDKPLKLRQWKVIDGQGHETGVSLENMSEGAVFPASSFIFTPPNFGKNR